MPDTIERTIYKLELDDSGYIRGVESMSASTKKLVDEQAKANKALLDSQTSLKSQSTYLQQTKKDLDAYTGTNEKYRQQLKKSFDTANADNQKLTEKVNLNKQAYDAATKAAQGFANVAGRASQLQAGTTGGKIPTLTPTATAPAQISSQIAGVLNVADFTKQAQVIEQTKNEFDDLRTSIGLAEERMKQLNATDEEFKQLAPVVAQGKDAIQKYDAATGKAVGSQTSLRTQLRLGREELVKLEQAGKGATKQYFELEKNVARLTDEFGDQQQRIKILASDTKLLDFGKGAITAATSAFQAYTAVSILVGDENEELQKKTMQLFAAMQLLQSLEQLSNLTRREGVLSTLAISGAQSVYTTVVGASTGALKAFRLALAATGIGAAIVLIGYLVNKWIEYKEQVKKAGEQQRLFKEINEQAIKSFAAEVVHLEAIRKKLTDLNIPQEKRIALAKEYNKTADESNKLDIKQIDNIDLLNSAIDRQISKIKERAIAKAAENVVTQKAEAFFNAEGAARVKAEQQVQDEGTRSIETISPNQGKQFEVGQTLQVLNGKTGKMESKVLTAKDIDRLNQSAAETHNAYTKYQEINRVNRLIEQDKDVKDTKEELDRASKLAQSLTTIEGLTTDTKTTDTKTKTDKALKGIQNEFARKKAELDKQLDELTRKEADNESKIRIEFAARLAKEQLEISKLLKEKKVTAPQAEILKAENVQINTLGLEKALADFNKKVTDSRKKLNDELNALQDKNTLDTLNLIQDEFTRRAALIEFNEQNELDAEKENTQKRLDALDFERLKIGEKAYQDAKAIIITNGEQAAINIIQKFAGERQVLSGDIFQGLLTAYDTAISNANLIQDEEQAKRLKAAKENFLAQKITYQQFQDEIKRIKDAHDRDIREGDLVVMKDQLQALDEKIAATKNKTTKAYAELLRQQKEFRKKIAAAESEQATDVPPPVVETKTGDDSFEARVRAIGALADSVIQFWQATNAAEEQALDRSIALQEKRVSAAQRIAERGNAEYLKQEQDRLDELNVKRENAARKQLGIDAALQASQILVGITGAISKIAHPTGIAETIAAMAIIFSSLAAGYSLVKSLQGNQPKLAKGTPYLTRDKHTSGIDTIPAWLTEGEAVIPQKRNKKYKKTVEAIYYEKVPADVLNEFVENYVYKTDSKPSETNKTENIVYDTTNENLSTYRTFVKNIEKVPTSILNQFIENYTKSSQSNYEEKKYFKGTSHVTGAPGKDTIPAWLTQGEAVIPVKENKSYRATVDAIYNKKVPAEVINDFVENYKKVDNVESKFSSKKHEIKEQIINRIKNELENFTGKSIHEDTSKLSVIVNKIINENSNALDVIQKVVNTVSDEKVSLQQVSSFLNTGISNFNENRTSSLINSVLKLVNEKIEQKNIVSRVVNDQSNKLTDIVNKITTEVTGSDQHFSLVEKVVNENINITNVQSLVSKVFNEIKDKFSKESIFRATGKVFNENISSVIKKSVNEITGTEAYSKVIDNILNQKENVISNFSGLKTNKSLIEKVVNEVVDKRNVFVSEVSNRVSSENKNVKKSLIDTLVSKEVNSFSREQVETLFNTVNRSAIIDKVFSENKKLVESKNVAEIVNKIVSETTDLKNKVSSNQLNSLSRGNTETRQIIIKDNETLNKIVTEKLTNEKYASFASNVSNIPLKTIEKFIKTYDEKNFVNNFIERKFFKGTPELKRITEPRGIDTILGRLNEGEAIIPTEKNNLYKPVINAIFNGSVPAEKINNFVKEYHSIKPVPQPHYERIKEAAEIHIGTDGRMAVLLYEQNRLIKDNNELQEKTIKTLHKLGVNVNLDQNGFAVTQMEVMEQMRRDVRT